MATSQGVWKAEDVVIVFIDYQDKMFDLVRSETNAKQIELNVKFLIRIAKEFNIPFIISTVGVELGVNGPTRHGIIEEAPEVTVIDRSSMNSWDDVNFVNAVKKTGKKRIIFGALFTEICLAYPVVDAIKDGYEAMFVVDAVGGLSQLAHQTAIDRLTAIGAVPNTTLALVSELYRDWKSPLVTPHLYETLDWYQKSYSEL